MPLLGQWRLPWWLPRLRQFLGRNLHRRADHCERLGHRGTRDRRSLPAGRLPRCVGGFPERAWVRRARAFTIQDSGGPRKTIERGIAMVRELLTDANCVRREPVFASHLCVGLQCGRSDGYSGISANPAPGAAVDRLARHGGAAILSETTEIYGAEHLLTRRAVSPEVGAKLLVRIAWWGTCGERNNAALDNNPSAANKAGGLTTMMEKSLGAVAKGGATNLVDVYEYAQPITAKGFVFMDSPGYDPMCRSATRQQQASAERQHGRGSVQAVVCDLADRCSPPQKVLHCISVIRPSGFVRVNSKIVTPGLRGLRSSMKVSAYSGIVALCRLIW